MKKQVVVIHGGNIFKTYRAYLTYLKSYKLDFKKLKTGGWKENLKNGLGKNFEVILLKMPNPLNARYKEWKIMFEKLRPFLKSNLILVGHSLGGIFLVKYLSENRFPRKILATLLVAPPFGAVRGKFSDVNVKDGRGAGYYLADFIFSKDLSKFQKQGGEIRFYFSKNDPIVPFAEAVKYKKVLLKAKLVVFKNKKHFNQTKFPELIKDIKKLS
jgi:hypothetical protein